jgi:hypothetical protein
LFGQLLKRKVKGDSNEQFKQGTGVGVTGQVGNLVATNLKGVKHIFR